MTDRMSEEFAAWYLAEVTESYGESVRAQAQKNLDWVREDGSFADPMLRLASLAWVASRESLVIELPAILAEDYDPLSNGAYREECRESIESAGLKVKI